jgi:hypothetical protein
MVKREPVEMGAPFQVQLEGMGPVPALTLTSRIVPGVQVTVLAVEPTIQPSFSTVKLVCISRSTDVGF